MTYDFGSYSLVEVQVLVVGLVYEFQVVVTMSCQIEAGTLLKFLVVNLDLELPVDLGLELVIVYTLVSYSRHQLDQLPCGNWKVLEDKLHT